MEKPKKGEKKAEKKSRKKNKEGKKRERKKKTTEWKESKGMKSNMMSKHIKIHV